MLAVDYLVDFSLALRPCIVVLFMERPFRASATNDSVTQDGFIAFASLFYLMEDVHDDGGIRDIDRDDVPKHSVFEVGSSSRASQQTHADKSSVQGDTTGLEMHLDEIYNVSRVTKIDITRIAAQYHHSQPIRSHQPTFIRVPTLAHTTERTLLQLSLSSIGVPAGVPSTGNRSTSATRCPNTVAGLTTVTQTCSMLLLVLRLLVPCRPKASAPLAYHLRPISNNGLELGLS
ncbi:hypothetical protein HN51_012692 [Arachis hypogaea]